MFTFTNRADDTAIRQSEDALRAVLANEPPEQGPSDAYWEMFATRVAARIERAERPVAPRRWQMVLRPATLMATVAAAIVWAVAPSEPALDRMTASLESSDVQSIRLGDAPVSPDVPLEPGTMAELASRASAASVDVDAVLAFADLDPERVAETVHASSLESEPYGLEELTDDDARTVISNLQSSL